MISLTSKERKWSLFFLLPFYFGYGQFVISFIFLFIALLLGFDIESATVDAIFNLVYLIILSICSLFIFKSYLKKSIEHMKGRWFKEILYCCTAGTVKFYLVNIISSLMILLLIPGSSSSNQDAIATMTGLAPTIMFITTVILAPFVEEMIFRVGIFQLVYHKGRLWAYLLSGLSFGFVHIMVGLFGGDFSQLLYLLPYSLLGIVLCNIYEKRNTIFAPMLVHMMNNLIAILVLL